MKLELTNIQSIGSAVVVLAVGWLSGVLTMFLKSHLERRREDRAVTRRDNRESEKTRRATDRAVFKARSTMLVRNDLAAFVRSGKPWQEGEADLRRFISSLDHGTYEHFLDPSVEGPWKQFIAMSVELSKLRLDGEIKGNDIWSYNLIRKEWEAAAKRSLGPLPQIQPATHSTEVETRTAKQATG